MARSLRRLGTGRECNARHHMSKFYVRIRLNVILVIGDYLHVRGAWLYVRLHTFLALDAACAAFAAAAIRAGPSRIRTAHLS